MEVKNKPVSEETPVAEKPATTASGDEATEAPKPQKNPPGQLMMAVFFLMFAIVVLVWSLNSIEDPLKRYKQRPTVSAPGM